MNERIVSRNSYEGVLSTNKVLRNTYFLLSMTLLWSAVVAGVAMAMNLPPVHWIVTLVGFYGLLFLTERNRDSSVGLVCVFALTGFMGYTLGPILNMYVGAGLGSAIVPALGGTALTFLACSAYALTTKRDLSFLNGVMLAGFIAIIVAVIANIFLQMSVLSLVISGMFVLFSSAAILLTTQSIVRGGETNYISATVTLYVSIYNLFLSLLQILGVVNSND
ncbi:TPA: Bax inhibitor-1/YccA family protein [Photobacterium damselae]|uniref:Modulator of FtsH protease YccA n=4 Tax=Photobacterium damselae TaxID=38293 RepID=A0A2T3QM11_PHODM|nr:Bax inhibitor-1/YccA family protein [Photobacterium damselae]ARR49114.1 BAX inhibitor protein [Photobacterium damselae subsp. damselae]AWK82062.1 BAX inhibitor protein [Photobacterium damselae]EHA1079250.1 Bax inhibitor-1/YccA family protein [Photobacterium damselae]ELI6449861.1 Bax inhibitor-1/YccA family protein [Photobacterium damselae]ELV7517384.1 Bax inhibitor-1/YccA family protein [Photobacterium damselae]